MRKFLSVVVLASLLVVAGLSIRTQPSVEAAAPGCDQYAIMHCGAAGPAEFINKARANGKGDLTAIYREFGLRPADYDRFASTAKQGTLHKDGRIVVNGVTVGRSTQNVGRVKDANFNQAVNIGGNTYWGGSFGSTYHADTADVSVMFNDEGVMQFVIINSCGNPQRFTSTKPTYTCDKLQKKVVDGKENTYTFTTKASATNGAQLVKAEYMFGDGTSKTVSDLRQPVQHTFTQDSTVRVRVTVKLPGGGTQTVTSTDCLTQIQVKQTPPPPPPTAASASCSALRAEWIDEDNLTYRFTATAVLTGGAVIKGADFNFGDGSSAISAAANGETVTIEHSYGKAGNYTTTAVLHFTGADGAALPDSNCSTSINPTGPPIPPEEKCVPTDATGKGAEDECQTLTDTGPGTLLTVFGGAGAIATAGHYVIRRRLLGL